LYDAERRRNHDAERRATKFDQPFDVSVETNISSVEASETREQVFQLQPNSEPPWDDDVAIELRALELSVIALDQATKIP